jgi:hypothetical protein
MGFGPVRELVIWRQTFVAVGQSGRASQAPGQSGHAASTPRPGRSDAERLTYRLQLAILGPVPWPGGSGAFPSMETARGHPSARERRGAAAAARGGAVGDASGPSAQWLNGGTMSRRDGLYLLSPKSPDLGRDQAVFRVSRRLPGFQGPYPRSSKTTRCIAMGDDN